MEIDVYFTYTEKMRNKRCTIVRKNGEKLEGIYCNESLNHNKLSMVIQMIGDTRKLYKNIGISDPYPTSVDALEIKDNKISLLITDIDSIEFHE